MNKRKKLKIKFINLWETATEEQKKAYQADIDHAYGIIFDKAFEELQLKKKRASSQ